MAHTLLEQAYVINSWSDCNTFLKMIFNRPTTNNEFKINPNIKSGMYFFTNSPNPQFYFCVKNSNTKINSLTNTGGTVFYHISEGESVKYFKYVQSSDTAENSYTYILAQDVNGEWVVFNGDKMYSDYGATGIYSNPQIGRPEIVDSGNQFVISKACRLDTGTKFNELHFVLSAKSYTDTNCIVDHGGKKYRLVSVSNVKDVTGRYPAFAFPVSD